MIGKGLFAKVLIPRKTRFISFSGEKITVEEHNLRRARNFQQGYSVYLNKDLVLDCYKTAHKVDSDPVGLAMMANSPRNLVNRVTGEKAKKNAKLVVNQGAIYLVSLRDIPPDTEMFYPYGAGYSHYIK